MKTERLESTEQMADFAAALLEGLLPREDGRATVLALTGDLGAGKTAFVKALAKHVGVGEDVTSPTFVIMKTYPITSGSDFKQLVHIDAYRMKDGHELSVLGWDTLLADPGNLIAIEWPELVADVMPDDAITLAFAHVDETTRDITHERHA